MAIAFVQSKSSTPASGNTIAYTSNNTAGNLLVAVCVSTSSVVPNTAFTDSQGNTWHVAQWTPEAQDMIICYAMNCKAGANTVTMTISGDSFTFFSIYEFSGAATSSALDVGSEGAAGTAPNVTTTRDGDLVFATLGAANSGGTAPTITVATGWSAGQTGTWAQGAGTTRQRDGYIVQSTHGSIGISGWTITNDSFGLNDSVIAAFFKPATGGLVDPGGMMGMVF